LTELTGTFPEVPLF